MTNVTQDMFGERHRIAVESLNGEAMPNVEPKTLAQGLQPLCTALWTWLSKVMMQETANSISGDFKC